MTSLPDFLEPHYYPSWMPHSYWNVPLAKESQALKNSMQTRVGLNSQNALGLRMFKIFFTENQRLTKLVKTAKVL